VRATRSGADVGARARDERSNATIRDGGDEVRRRDARDARDDDARDDDEGSSRGLREDDGARDGGARGTREDASREADRVG